MADEFDKLIYVLSTLLHVRAHAPLMPSIQDREDGKYVELLNDIALALTTKAKGDVTAVMLKQSATAIQFLYSKNAPCNGSLDVYLQAIKDAIAKNEDIRDIQCDVMDVVVSSCIEKFRHRAIKCKKAAESCNNVTPSEDNGTKRNLCNFLEKWEGLSATEIITKFLDDLRNLDTSIQAFKANKKTCVLLSQQACLIGLGKSLQQYPTLLRRVQKLGAYYGLSLRIKKVLKIPNIFKLRGNISFLEIPPPPQKTLAVTWDLAEILNDDANKSHGDLVTMKDITSKYPNQSISETGSITVSAHCELTLALYSYNSPSKPKTVEIGVSKGLCWLCQKFVEYLNATGAIKVVVSANHGKIHTGWGMPPNTPSEIEFKMRQLVELEVKELHARILARRLSDSFPNELRDEFIEEENADMYQSSLEKWFDKPAK